MTEGGLDLLVAGPSREIGGSPGEIEHAQQGGAGHGEAGTKQPHRRHVGDRSCKYAEHDDEEGDERNPKGRPCAAGQPSGPADAPGEALGGEAPVLGDVAAELAEGPRLVLDVVESLVATGHA